MNFTDTKVWICSTSETKKLKLKVSHLINYMCNIFEDVSGA